MSIESKQVHRDRMGPYLDIIKKQLATPSKHANNTPDVGATDINTGTVRWCDVSSVTAEYTITNVLPIGHEIHITVNNSYTNKGIVINAPSGVTINNNGITGSVFTNAGDVILKQTTATTLSVIRADGAIKKAVPQPVTGVPGVYYEVAILHTTDNPDSIITVNVNSSGAVGITMRDGVELTDSTKVYFGSTAANPIYVFMPTGTTTYFRINSDNIIELELPEDTYSTTAINFTGCKKIQLTDEHLAKFPLAGACYIYNMDYTGDIANVAKNKNITSLYGYSNNMYGDISSFSDHPSVGHLLTYTNDIGGKFNDLVNAPKVKRLYLGYTGVYGNTENINRFPLLEVYYSYENKMYGKLDDFANCTKLKILLMRGDTVTGNIASLSTAPALYALLLRRVNVTGTLADAATIPGLQYLDLTSTNVTGDIIDLAGTIVKRHTYSGSIGIGGQLSDLPVAPQFLLVNGTAVTGSIGSIADKSVLYTLNIGYGDVTATAADIGMCPKLAYLYISGTVVTGTMDTNVMPALLTLSASNANVTGSLGGLNNATKYPKLSSLYIGNTNIIGTTDRMTSVTITGLDVTGSKAEITGPITDLVYLANFSMLKTAYSGVTSTVADYAVCTALKTLAIGHNTTGTAEELIRINTLKTVSMLDCPVTGDVKSLGMLPNLTTLYIDASPITGNIADMSNKDTLVSVVLKNTDINVSLAGLNTMSKLTAFTGRFCPNVSGSVNDIDRIKEYTTFDVTGSDVSGDVTALPLSITTLGIAGTSILCTTAQLLEFKNLKIVSIGSQISTSLTSLLPLIKLSEITALVGVIGDLSDLIPFKNMRRLFLAGSSVTCTTALTTLSEHITELDMTDCNLTTAMVDNVLNYSLRTDRLIRLKLGGNNAARSSASDAAHASALANIAVYEVN